MKKNKELLIVQAIRLCHNRNIWIHQRHNDRRNVMKKRVIAVLVLAALCLSAVPAAAAEQKEIVTLSTSLVRVELLSETLVRAEAVGKNGGFEDRATLTIAGRDSFDGVQATVRESSDAYTAVTDAYTVTLKKNTAFADNAVEIRSADGELLWRYDSGLSKEGLGTVPAVTSDTVAYYAYPNGVAANNGLTALTAKQGWSGANGIAGMVKNGGTLVFSGRGYVGASYTLPKLTSALKMTGVAPDGSNYRRAGAGVELNARSGSFSPKPGSVFTIQSDVVFDDIILLSTGAQTSTIRVTGGATVAFGEGVTADVSANGYPYLALEIEADSRVLYSGGAFSAIRGSGTLVVTEDTVKKLSDALLSDFRGHLVFADGESLCGGYQRHSARNGTCSRCGAELGADSLYVPTNGFYAELPPPSETPDVFALADSPRVIPAEDGMAYAGSTDTYSGWERNDAVDLYLFLPQGNAQTLRADFVRLTGRTPISNIKTFGSWYSRYEDWTEKDYLSVIENYRANDFPLDVLVVDTKWRSGADGTGYDIDTDCFPDMMG